MAIYDSYNPDVPDTACIVLEPHTEAVGDAEVVVRIGKVQMYLPCYYSYIDALRNYPTGKIHSLSLTNLKEVGMLI